MTTLSNEDPAQYLQRLNDLRAVYLPLNGVAESIVGDIAAARGQILRLDSLVARHWELALADETLHAAIHRFNRQIDQLHIRIARLERRLKFIHKNFPQEAPVPVEDTTATQNHEDSEKPILVKDACPETIAFFQRHYPKSPIIISPPAGVGNRAASAGEPIYPPCRESL